MNFKDNGITYDIIDIFISSEIVKKSKFILDSFKEKDDDLSNILYLYLFQKDTLSLEPKRVIGKYEIISLEINHISGEELYTITLNESEQQLKERFNHCLSASYSIPIVMTFSVNSKTKELKILKDNTQYLLT